MQSNFENIIHRARRSGKKRFVIAGAANVEVMKSIYDASRSGMMEPILIGKKSSVNEIGDSLNIDLSNWRIENSQNEEETAHIAAQLLSNDEADILMKGYISTPVLLKIILEEQYHLRTGNLLSHVALMEIPTYHKLLMFTDSGMIIRPDLEQKAGILKNAIHVMQQLGVVTPKIAILAANEKVSHKMPETVDAAELVKRAQSQEFGDAIIEGPLAFDMAFSKDAVKIKNYESRVAGDPDICLMPDVASGNILAKGLIYLGNSKIAGAIVGAKMPIVLISRAESAETWVRSIALTNLLASSN